MHTKKIAYTYFFENVSFHSIISSMHLCIPTHTLSLVALFDSHAMMHMIVQAFYMNFWLLYENGVCNFRSRFMGIVACSKFAAEQEHGANHTRLSNATHMAQKHGHSQKIHKKLQHMC